MAITNMSGYTYRFFGNLTEASEFDYTFNFICNDKKYTRILFSPTDALLYFTEDGDVIPALTILDGVYEWVDDAFMMFDIIDGRDVANAEAIEILSGLGEFTLTEDEKDVFVKGAYKWNNTIERPTQTLTFSNFKAYNKTFTGDVAIDVLDDLYGIVDMNTGIGLYLNTIGWLDGSVTLNELLSGSTPVASDIYQIWDFGEGTYLKNKAYKYLVANSEVYEIPEETKPVVLTLKDELVLATSENQLFLLQPSDYDVDFPVKFTLYLDNIKVASFEFEFNMTWEQFINSKYNTENYFYTKDDNKVYYRYDNYVIENQTIDSIILQQDYTLLELEPPTEEDEPIIPDVPDEPIEPEEPTIMNFVIKVDGAFDGIYSFEKGMTWQDFVESDYNSAGYFTVLDDINYVIYRNEFIVKNVIYTSVIENKEYDTFKELEEPDIPDLPDIPDVPSDAIVKLKKMMENISSSLKYKLGTSEKINAQQFSNKILDIQTGVQVDGTKNISENGSYDVSTYAIANVNVPNIVNGVPIEISSLDSSLLIAENENKLYRYGGEIYKVVADMETAMLVDLTGATIIVPAGWTASSAYGKFFLAGTATYNDSTKILTTGAQSFNIGYWTASSSSDNYIYINLEQSGFSISNSNSFKLNITGGNNRTNQDLIQWFLDNNATIEGGVWTITNFTFQKLISPSGTKQITANDTYDIKEYENVEVNVPNIINGIPIEIPSLDSSYLIEENQGKIYKCDGKLYRVINDNNINDLVGAQITVPSGWSCTSGYTMEYFTGSFSVDGVSYNFYEHTNKQSNFYIGFSSYSQANSIAFKSPASSGGTNNIYITPSQSFTLNIISSANTNSGANNQKILQWLKDNNAVFENLIFQEILSPTGTLEITSNGEVDVKSYEKVNVSVESSGGDNAINGVIEQYKVNAGATINAGDFVEFINKFGTGEFHTGNTHYLSACKLDNNRVLVAYQDLSNNYGTAVILTINNSIISVGNEVVFNSGYTYYTSVCALTENKAIVCFINASNGSRPTSVVLTIEETNITVGEIIALGFASSSYASVCALTENKAIVCFSNSSDYGYAVVLTIDGTTITYGTAVSFRGSEVYPIAVCVLTESKVLVAYQHYQNYYYGYAVVLTIDGTTISVGSVTGFRGASANKVSNISVCALTENKALVCFRDGANSNYGTATLLTISGSSITKNATATFKNNGVSYTSVCALTENKAIVVFGDEGNSNYCTGIVLTIDSTTISVGTPTLLTEYVEGSTTSSGYKSIIPFSSNNALVLFIDGGLGKYSSVSITDTTILVNDASGTYVEKAKSRLHNVGVAKTGGSEGQTIEVYCVDTE